MLLATATRIYRVRARDALRKALPNIVFDDWAVQWTIFLVCLFFGFIGYGMLGEQRFSNALHNLKNISPNSLSKNIKFQFENLIEFTYSSYFLPSTGKRNG